MCEMIRAYGVNMKLKYIQHNYNMIIVYVSDCQLTEPASEAQDDLAAVRLWDVSCQMVGYKEEN